MYVDTVAYGLQKHAWQEPQLAALQEQLKGINLTPFIAAAFEEENAAKTHAFETDPVYKNVNLLSLYSMVVTFDDISSSDADTFWQRIKFWQRLKNSVYMYLELAPHGWWYQNQVACAEFESRTLDGFDLKHDTISPRVFDEVAHNLKQLSDHKSPFNLWAAIVVPNATKATQTLARNQTMVNEAQIVCALERCRLAHGDYPGTLDALVPQFIEKLPHDIIGGKPLIYRRTADGKFLLYSVGWNEKDDGGQQESPQTKNGAVDFEKGDWVWQYPIK
jgi:hypothetical protein